MLSLLRDAEERGQTCKIYWCDKTITLAKIQSYLRKKKVTESEVLAGVKTPYHVPSHIVVEVLPANAEAPEVLPSHSAGQPESSVLAPISTGSPETERSRDGSGYLKRRACVACRRIKAKCDFSGECEPIRISVLSY